jgi:hypothetical protein
MALDLAQATDLFIAECDAGTSQEGAVGLAAYMVYTAVRDQWSVDVLDECLALANALDANTIGEDEARTRAQALRTALAAPPSPN